MADKDVQDRKDYQDYVDYQKYLSGVKAPAQSKAPADETAFTPSNSWGKIGEYGSNTLGALGKLGGVLRNLTTGPATAAILKATTGKDVTNPDELKSSIDLTNLKQMPSNAEMFQRAGVNNPELSDLLPGMYVPKGSSKHWYQPEKGGALDPSVAGALQVATDPAMYLGVGEAGKGAEVIKDAAQGPLSKLAGAVNKANPAKYLGKGVDALADASGLSQKVRPSTLFNPVSAGLNKAIAKPLYGATLLPVEHEGERFGKAGIDDTLYNAGAWRTGNVIPKAQAAKDALVETRQGMFDKTPGNVDMDAALSPGYERVAQLRQMGSKDAASSADALEAELNSVRDRAKGTPGTAGTPDRTVRQDSSILGEDGRPLQTDVTVPGTPGQPGIPPQPYTRQGASDLKTYYAGTLPRSAHMATKPTPVDVQGLARVTGGLSKQVEEAVPAEAAALKDINAKYGQLAGTTNSQFFVKSKADRAAADLLRGTGADAVTTGLGAAAGGIPGAGAAFLGKKALQALFMGTMPTGYALRKLSDAGVLDRLNSLVQQSQPQKGTK